MSVGHGGLILAAGVLMALAAPAAAQQPTQQQIDAVKSSCRWDFMSHCSGVPRGGREALMCLKDHLAELSAGCKTAVSAIIPKNPPATPTAAPPPPPAPAAPAAASASPPPQPPAPAAAPPPAPAPTADTAAPAPTATPKKHATAPPPKKPAGPATRAPTQATASPPPPAPAAAAPPPTDLGPIPPLRPLVRLRILRACKAEHDAVCGQVPPGQGRIVDCLAAHGAALSPSCRDAILSAK
jgi:hypothetical protein